MKEGIYFIGVVLAIVYACLLPHYPYPLSDEKFVGMHLIWMAPIYSCQYFIQINTNKSVSGYGAEAISIIKSVQATNDSINLYAQQHGDIISNQYVKGLPEETRNNLKSLPIFSSFNIEKSLEKEEKTIVFNVCHSEPGAWYPANYQTSICPHPSILQYYTHPEKYPIKKIIPFTIGRTMFETDRLPSGWKDKCNSMDEIWVTTDFHYQIFKEGGVDPTKLYVIGEPVDISEFDSSIAKKIELTEFQYELGVKPTDSVYQFLSIFKWETRKGWEILLESYFNEFTEGDNVSLCILSNPYHQSESIKNSITKFIEEKYPTRNHFPHLVVLKNALPQTLIPSLYKSADAFVLPSRGEGWGRPHIEAMAMGLPTIATNFSGNLEFMKDFNSFLIQVDEMIPIKEGAFAGHYWAQPSVSHLQSLMRFVYSNPEKAKEVGEIGRNYVTNNFSPSIIGKKIMDRLHYLQNNIKNKK